MCAVFPFVGCPLAELEISLRGALPPNISSEAPAAFRYTRTFNYRAANTRCRPAEKPRALSLNFTFIRKRDCSPGSCICAVCSIGRRSGTSRRWLNSASNPQTRCGPRKSQPLVKSMPETGRIEIRLLGELDIPAAMKLKELARWNQTENDWHCLLQLEPRGCFGAFLDGSLVGTTTSTTYGRELAWIGMVLVNPQNRRCGIATRLIKTALDYLRQKVITVKLDATPEGRRVYEGLGFEAESLIERWAGIARATPVDDSNNVETAADMDIETRFEMVELDRRVFGADRSRLIETLIDNACVAPVLTRTADRRLSGYGLARRGTNAGYVGPSPR